MGEKANEESMQQLFDHIPINENADEFKAPYYEGKDTHLAEKPYCYACNDRNVDTGLKCCSRCHVAWYCSAQCQKKHFKEHRELCKEIAEQVELVEQAAIPLRSWEWDSDDDEEPENFFEVYAGGFDNFDLGEVQEYLEARTNLADLYWFVAQDWEVREVWEKALSHYLEILRLVTTDHCEVRHRVPFILLHLNRDDDAYAFLRYWLLINDLGLRDIRSRHQNSREGDWMYPIELDCRYRDIVEDCPVMNIFSVDDPYLVALAIIKLRVIASHDAVSRALDYAFQNTNLEHIHEAQSIVQEMLVCTDIASQRQQLDSIFDHVHPCTLDAMDSFEELSSELFQSVLRLHPVLIDATLRYGIRDFFRVPGAAEVLRRRAEENDYTED